MKQKILFICFSFLLLSAAAQGQVPEPTYISYVEFPIPLGYPHRSEASTVRATLYVYTHDNGFSISDPIIIPEGFDAANEHNWSYLYNRFNQSNTIECLRSLGYDFIIISYADGGNYLELNAYAIAQVIKKINAEKITNHQNIVFGPSMGGLLARYALTYMEHENIDHNTRLYISYDSPHLGANGPGGIQVISKFFYEIVKKLHLLDVVNPFEMLGSKAARQMLIHHIDASMEAGEQVPDPLRQSFLNNLEAIGSWPKKLRKVGMSNGSGYGHKTLKDDGFTELQPGDYIADFEILNSHNWAKAVPLPGVTQEIARVKVPGQDDITVPVTGTLPYDNMPGGFFRFGEHIPWNTSNAKSQCFIPLFSSLAIPSNDNYYNISADPNALSKTPFDAIYYSEYNSEHVSISQENKSWLLNEIYPYQRLHIYTPSIQPPRGSVNLMSYGEITLFPGTDLTSDIGALAYINTSSSPRCNTGPVVKENMNPVTSPGKNVIQVIHSQTNANGSDPEHSRVSEEGISDSSSELNAYPNPSGGIITLSHTSPLQLVEVYNLSGVMIYKRQGLTDYKATLDLSAFPTGMYLLKVNTNDGQIHYKKVTIE